jgi:hypothetical protein
MEASGVADFDSSILPQKVRPCTIDRDEIQVA